jgi:hypothetical protein
MILDLVGGLGFIRVTAEYSNAVLVAMMPYVSDYARKLDLPVPHPTTTAHVLSWAVVPIRDSGATVTIQGGWGFGFPLGEGGHFMGFRGPHAYFSLQDPGEIPKFYAKNKTSRAEAITLARQTITKLGLPLETVFAEQEPQVTGPLKLGTNVIPHFLIEWLDPRSGPAVQVEVNGQVRRVEEIRFSGFLGPPVPGISTGLPPPEVKPQTWPQVSPAYARALVPMVLRALDAYGQKLALPVPRPLTTNHVARFFVADNGGWPHCEIELTNGWRFIFRNSMVNGYYSPDNLFSSGRRGDVAQRKLLIKDFVGKWRTTEPEAAAIVKHTLAKLNYPTNQIHMDFQPEVRKPAVPNIPRYFISWRYKPTPDADDIQSKVEAEVDAATGELKSLYYDDKTYWNHPPPINLPISLQPDPTTRNPITRGSAPLPFDRPPSPPHSRFNPPVPK